MNILQEADQLTSVDRRADYGHPYDFYLRVSKVWEGILGIPIPPEEIGLMMVAFKIAREASARKRDGCVPNSVDFRVRPHGRRSRCCVSGSGDLRRQRALEQGQLGVSLDAPELALHHA
jgi:hypothetical protein